MSEVIVNNLTTREKLVWRSIRIKKSLDNICHTLEMEIPPSERLKVNRHHRLEVRFENPLVITSGGTCLITTVLVDGITSAADSAKCSVTVIGRSPARDIIDSTWMFGNDHFATPNDPNQTLKSVVQQIARKFNINCYTLRYERVDDPTGIISFFDFVDESPWMRLINEADNQGFILTSDAAGNFCIWRVQAVRRKEPFKIKEGKNVKSIKWTENGAEQFHKYIVKGGRYEAIAIDDTCPGNRTLTYTIDDPFVSQLELERRAKTEKLRRKENKIVVTVPGWGLTDEQIKGLGKTKDLEMYWVPNLLVPVKIPSLGLGDEDNDLLISEVEYTATADTMSCDITLVNREMYA